MKQRLLVIFCAMLLVVACRKNRTIIYEASGTLSGFDLALCPCCGGVILEGDDNKIYHIETLPGVTDQDFGNLTFPKKIKYNYTINRVCGGITYLDITTFKFIN